MKYLGLSLALCVAASICGCDSIKKSGSGAVAIIDLDLVAKRLGRDAKMATAIEQHQVNLNQQLATVQTTLQEKVSSTVKSFGESPNEEQTKQLTLLQREANLKLNGVRQQAQANMTQFQQSVVNQFREEAKPIAKQLAAEKGCNIVLTKNDTVVFAFDSVVDITEETIEKMKALPPTSESAVERSAAKPGANAVK